MTIQQSPHESMNASSISAPSSFISMKFSKRSRTSSVIRTETAATLLPINSHFPEKSLVTSLARAFYWKKLLDEGVVSSGSEIAKHENLDPSTVNELLRLTLLDPYIVKDIMSGDQPERLTALWFTRNALPIEWRAQQILMEKLRHARRGSAISGEVHDQA